MQNIQDFIRWALTHAKSVPTGAATPYDSGHSDLSAKNRV